MKKTKALTVRKTSINPRASSYIHDWLEQPERRTEIEALNG